MGKQESSMSSHTVFLTMSIGVDSKVPEEAEAYAQAFVAAAVHQLYAQGFHSDRFDPETAIGSDELLLPRVEVEIGRIV